MIERLWLQAESEDRSLKSIHQFGCNQKAYLTKLMLYHCSKYWIYFQSHRKYVTKLLIDISFHPESTSTAVSDVIQLKLYHLRLSLLKDKK